MEGFAIYFNFTFALLGKHADCGTQIRSPERTTLEDTDEKAPCELGAEWLELRASVGCRSSEEWGNCQRCHPCCSGRNGFGGILETGDSFSISFDSDEDFFTGCHLYPQRSSKITPPPLLSFVRVEYRACIFPKPTFSLFFWQVAHFLSTCELSILVFLLSSWLQVRDVWQSYELELVNYQNKCRIIRGWDDLFTKVKEHINSVSAMKLSPYYKVWCTLVWLEYNLLLMQLKGCEMLLNFF